MRPALALAVVAVLAAAPPATASSSFVPLGASDLLTAQSGLDYGDAPDGRPAGYAGKPQVRGTFPSRAASGGPRHSTSGPSIGGWSGEADSRQVDRDNDDGAGLTPRRCATSTLTVAVDASRADPSLPIYANAWFDWNRDGDWADGGSRRCGPEWGIQNMAIEPASLGEDRIALVTLRFRAGRVPRQFWWRVQVHSGPAVPHMGGGGQGVATSGGETEDWLYTRSAPRREGRVTLRCVLPFSIIDHTMVRGFLFRLEGVEDARISVRDVRYRLAGEAEGLVLADLSRSSYVKGEYRWPFEVQSTEQHERDPFLQSAYVRLEVDVLINGRRREFQRRCYFAVAHAERIAPPVPPPDVLTPVIGVRIDPDRPDPVKAKCAARFTPSSAGGPPGGTVLARCIRIDVKTISIATSRQFTFWDVGTKPCELDTEPNSDPAKPPRHLALRCFPEPGNKARNQSVGFATDQPFVRLRLHLLAGGRGRVGNTIVLLQDFFISRDGIRCSQTIPRAFGCTTF